MFINSYNFIILLLWDDNICWNLLFIWILHFFLPILFSKFLSNRSLIRHFRFHIFSLTFSYLFFVLFFPLPTLFTALHFPSGSIVKKILRTSLPTFTTLPCYHCPFDLIFIYHFWFVFCFLSTSGRVMRWSNSPPSCTEPLRRVQSLKFRSEEQSDLNDILLRVSAFGLFVYAVFSVIAGGMGAFTHEPNLLVMITGCLSVLQVRCWL